MGFGEAYINIQLLTQIFLDPPIIYSKEHDRIVANPKIHHKLGMYRWYIGNCFITSVHTFSAIHLTHLLKHFDIDTASKSEKEEIFVYIFTVAITAQAIATWFTLEKSPELIAEVETKIFRAYNIKYKGWPNSNRRADIFEITAYVMASGFFLYPFTTIILPIIRTYDPINQLLETLIPFSIHPKLQLGIVICLYFWSVLFGALSCLNILLLTMAHSFSLTTIAKTNLKLSMECVDRCPSIKYSKIKTAVITVNSNLTFYEIQYLETFFHKMFMKHYQFRIMITGLNIALDWYIPSSTMIGMSLCICSNYGLIELLGRLPRIMEVSIMATTFGLSFLTIHLLHYAASALTYSDELILFWQKIKMGKLVRRRLKAMTPIGFAMGPYFSIKKRTALDIMDTILNYTASALMG